MDIDEAYERMQETPQTYMTLLGEIYYNTTKHRILRRKLNRDFKDGFVYKCIIPYSGLCNIMYYPTKKEYYIFFIKKNVYCAKKYIQKKDKIYLEEVKRLSRFVWEDMDDLSIKNEDIIKVL